LSRKTVLVFGAHPDDEVIGCGGTLAKLAKQEYKVIVVIFCWGETGYAKIKWKKSMAQIRREEAEQAAKILGIKEKIGLGKPSQGIVNDKETYQQCVRLIRKYRPQIIFTHWHEDRHRDHKAVSQVTEGARYTAGDNVLADMGKPWYTPKLLFYEVLELFTHPSHVVDISDTFEKKIEAMKAYKSQHEVLSGILDYLEGVAKARGFIVGVKYAEAFLDSHLLPQKGLEVI
jgi:bacillithiol biosynthesis deacetylase BshB1